MVEPSAKNGDRPRGMPARALLSVVALVAALAMSSAAVASDTAKDVASPIDTAKQLMAKGDLRGAEIQLRNAARADPNDPEPHIELAKLYLLVGNQPAAEAEARLARQDNGDANKVDPLLAETLQLQSKFQTLFDLVKPSTRDPKVESQIRMVLGLAHLSLHENVEAEPLLRDAERLDEGSAPAKVALARLLVAKNDLAGAEAELSRARAIAPNDVSMLRLSGEVLYQKGDTSGALKQFNEILDKNPNDLGALLDRANVDMIHNDLDGAKRDLDNAHKAFPKDITTNFLTALLAAKRGNLKQADEQLTAISEYFNVFPDGYYLLGSVEYALGEYALSEANLTKYASRNPTFAPARELLAMMALARRGYADATTLLEPVVAADPGDIKAVGLLARAYMATGKRDSAVELLQKAAEATTDNSRSQTNLAVLAMQIGQTAQGLTQLATTANKEGGADVAGPILVLTDLRSGKTTAAATEAETLVQHNDKDIIAKNLLGIVRMEQRDFADAATIFADIVQRNPNLIQAQRNLARADVALHKPDDAKKILEAMLEKQPTDVQTALALAGADAATKDDGAADAVLAKTQLAVPKNPAPGIERLRLLMALKSWDKAKQVARELEGQFPANPAIIETAAQMLYDSGDKAGAANEYRQVVQALPRSAVALGKYAVYQYDAGDQAGARGSLEKAIDLAPENAFGYMTLLVNFDYGDHGPDAALATAAAFAPKHPIESALLQANVLVRAKRLDDAVDLLTQAERKQADAQLVVRLAEFTYLAGKRDVAMASLSQWLKDHDGDTQVRLQLANMEIDQKDFDHAQADYERVLAQAPNNSDALSNLAWIYARKGDKRAHDLAEQGFNLSPSPERADILGWALVGDGNAKAAVRYLRSALNARPQDALVQYHLAAALNATGDTDEAKALLEKVVKSDAAFDGKDDAKRLLDQMQHG